MKKGLHSSKKFLELRDELTTQLAWVAGIMAILVIVWATVDGAFDNWEFIFFSGCSLLLLGIASIGNGYPNIRALALIFVVFVPGLLITLSWGVTGGGRLYLAAAVVLAGSLFGTAAGIVALVASITALGVIGSIAVMDPTFLEPDAVALSSRASWWIWFGASYTLTTSISLFVVLYLLHRAFTGIEAEATKSQQLEDINLDLKALQDRYELMVTHVSDVIWMTGLDLRYTYVSPSVEKLFGFKPESFIESDTAISTSEKELALWQSLVEQGLKKEGEDRQINNSELIASQVTHKNGSTINVEIRAEFLFDDSGEPIGIVGVTRKVEDKQALEQMMDAVLLGTARNQGTDFFESLATSLAEVLNVNVVLVGQLVEDRLVRTRAVYNSGEIVNNIEYTLAGTPCEQVLMDGVCTYPAKVQELFPEDFLLKEMDANSYIGSPLRGPDGEPLGLIAALHGEPIGDMKLASKLLGIFGNHASAEMSRQEEQHEKESISQQLQKVQRIESIGLLAGGVAHDFNNLLVVISGYLELLEIEFENSRKEVGEALSEMRQAADRATALTRQLLTFSRRQVMEMKPLDVNEMMEGLGKLFERLLTANIEYNYSLDAKDVWVKGDIGQLEQAMMNLVVNARDAMPLGGKLRISAGRTIIDEEYVDTHPWADVGEYVTLSVEDSGTGMSEEVLEHIFEPFFTTKPVDKGTGLGMSVYFGVVKQHGGFTQIYSEPGHGTRVLTYLPASNASVVEDEEARNTSNQRGEEFILLVEDNEQVRLLNERILIEKGYRVATAADGEEAMMQYEKFKKELSLIVLDVVLPKENGDKIMRRIRDMGDDILILFTSGYAPGGIHTSFSLNEELDFIQKPFKPTELLHRIREMLDNKKTGKEYS